MHSCLELTRGRETVTFPPKFKTTKDLGRDNKVALKVWRCVGQGLQRN